MNLTEAPINAGLSEVALDARAHLLRVRGDASLVTRELRTAATAAMAARRSVLIVDLSAATNVGGPVAWELSRAHERLVWRAGRVIVVFDSSVLGPLFEAFGLHRTPDVVPTIDAGLTAANVGEAGMAVARGMAAEQTPAPPPGPPGNGAGVAGPHPRSRGAGTRTCRRRGASNCAAGPRRRSSRGPPSGASCAWADARAAAEGRPAPRQRDGDQQRAARRSRRGRHDGADGDGDPRVCTCRGHRSAGRVRAACVPERRARAIRPRPAIVHSLAKAWGVDSTPVGRVWFELPCATA